MPLIILVIAQIAAQFACAAHAMPDKQLPKSILTIDQNAEVKSDLSLLFDLVLKQTNARL
jgi:hypothetical protein